MNTHNGHSGIFLTWFTNKLLQKKPNLITSHYLAQLLRYKYATSVRSPPHKTRVVNCLPSFLTICITPSSKISVATSRINFFKFWHLSTMRRIVLPLNPGWKENIPFTLPKRVPIVVFITGHDSYNCTKLMHNEEVFYTHFPFCFNFTTRQAMYVSCNNEVHLCNHCCSRRAIRITYSISVCL